MPTQLPDDLLVLPMPGVFCWSGLGFAGFVGRPPGVQVPGDRLSSSLVSRAGAMC